MSKELEYLNKKISDLEYSIAHPTEYTLHTLFYPIKVRIDDSAIYKKELGILKSIKDSLEAIEKVGQCKSSVSLLEALDTLYYSYNDLKKLEQSYKCLKGYLTSEALKPSEALECLEEIRDFRYGKDKLLVCQTQMYDIIQQALIQAERDRKELDEYKKLNISLLKKVLENGVWVKGEFTNFYHLSPTDMNVVIKDDGFVIQELYFEDLDCVMDTTGFELYSSDYKTKFWLKEDKSE